MSMEGRIAANTANVTLYSTNLNQELMPLHGMICSRSRHGRTGTFDLFFDSHCSCCRSNPEIRWRPLFPNTALQRAKGNLEAKKGKKEQHITTSFVALSPCKHVQKRTCECSKTPDQTRPDHPAKSISQSRATSIHFSYKQEGGSFWKNICSFLSTSLSRSEIHDRLPGIFGGGKLIGKSNYSTGN